MLVVDWLAPSTRCARQSLLPSKWCTATRSAQSFLPRRHTFICTLDYHPFDPFRHISTDKKPAKLFLVLPALSTYGSSPRSLVCVCFRPTYSVVRLHLRLFLYAVLDFSPHHLFLIIFDSFLCTPPSSLTHLSCQRTCTVNHRASRMRLCVYAVIWINLHTLPSSC